MMQEFVQAVNESIDRRMEGIHTAVPGIITDYDRGSGLATVMPKMQFKKPNGELIEYPAITGVPVVMPCSVSADAYISIPVKAGDGCLLVFSEQALDYWLYGQQTDADLKFDMTNAICIPGLYRKPPRGLREACDGDSLVFQCKGSSITISGTGVHIKGNLTIDGDETVDGSVTVDGGITASGDATIIGNAAIEGDAAISGDVAVGGDADVTGSITAGANVSADTIIADGATVNGNLTVTGITSSDTVMATGTISTTGDISVIGSVIGGTDVLTGSGVSLKDHTHTESGGGSTTNPN